MLKIGLTGGICSGKSLVLDIIRELYDDVSCFSADKMAVALSSPGGAIYTEIIDTFGSQILKDSGAINRKKLSEIVFKDNKKLILLEKIIHPLLKKTLEKEMKQLSKESKKRKKNVILAEVPLLYEAKYENLFDYILLVACSEDYQIVRCQKRDGLSEDSIRQRMMRQIPLREKVEKADFIIDNNVGMNEMRRQLEILWSKVIQKKQK